MGKKKIVIFSLVLLSSFTYLSANSLESLVNNSIENSTQIKSLELNKTYTMLSLEGSELDAKTRVSVGLSSYNLSSDESYNIAGDSSGLLNIVIPGSYVPTSADQASDTTTISIDGGLKYTPTAAGTSADPILNAKGSLGLSHNFLIGDYTNNQRALNNQITLLKANQAYENGVINFKKNIYSSISNIITNEKTQKEYEKKVKDQEKLINDSLLLNQITKESLTYKQYNLILKTYQNALENLKAQYESLVENFREYTGVDYVKVDEIREPNLEVNDSNTESLSVQLARLNLKLKQDAIDQVEREKTQSYLNLATSVERPYQLTSSSDMSVGARATYNSNNFSINAGTQLDFDFDSSPIVSPGFSVGGTWTNDTTSESDVIQNKLNENELISAQLALNSTIQNQMLTKLTLNTQITNWISQYNQLMDNIQFNKDNLSLQKQMFELGLISQSDLDDLAFEIEQLNYDKLTLLLDGLTIELDIAKMNL